MIVLLYTNWNRLIKLRPSSWFFIFIASFVSFSSYGQMNCVHGHQITLNDQCEAVLSPQDFLQGTYSDYSIYEVNLLNAYNQPIGNVANYDMIGSTWRVKVDNTTNTNSCTSLQVTFIDAMAPEISCSSSHQVVDCTIDLDEVLPPVADDNCSVNSSLVLVSESYSDPSMCDDGQMVLHKTWKAIDEFGNSSDTCIQVITIEKPAITFPKDITWTCDQYITNPSIINSVELNSLIVDSNPSDGQNDIDVQSDLAMNILSNTGSGIPSGYQGTYCNYNVEVADTQYEHCGGSTFKIHRKWTITDMCTFEITTHTQLIVVDDVVAPAFDFSNSTIFSIINGEITLTLSANNYGQGTPYCTSTDFIPLPGISDNCSGVDPGTIQIFTPAGQVVNLSALGGYIPAPGLIIGQYPNGLTYRVADHCGNIQEQFINLVVVDDTPPTMHCDQITKVALTSNGLAVTNATVFDDGSYDNCCLQEFDVKRLNSTCPGQDQDLFFGPNITFCCEDIGDSIEVVLRAKDCFGNTNECMVVALVEDNYKPQCYAPWPVSIDCHVFDFSLEPYGDVSYGDNCSVDSVSVHVDWSQFNDECNYGTITRTWTVSDTYGNTGQCSQAIQVNYVQNFSVKFPDDVTNNVTDTVPPVILDACGPVTWGVEDLVLIPQDQCIGKIYRTWTINDWCDFDLFFPYTDVNNPTSTTNGTTAYANATNRGKLKYIQEIDIYDNAPPTISCPDDTLTFCDYSTNCAKDVQLSISATDDFMPGSSFAFSYYYQLDVDGDGVFDELVTSADADAPQITVFAIGKTATATIAIDQVALGTQRIVWSVNDGCGKVAICEYQFVVKDCLPPTVSCEDYEVDLTVDNTGQVNATINIADLLSIAGDNCTPTGELNFELIFDSQSGDAISFDCDQLGQSQVTLSVMDNSGNTASCESTITLQDPTNQCGGTIGIISGYVTNEIQIGISNVALHFIPLPEGLADTTVYSDETGYYEAELPINHSYRVELNKSDDLYSTGIDVADEEKMYHHVLANPYLPTAYRVLAGDVLGNGASDYYDLIELRRLVLGYIDEFVVPVWSFYEKDCQFGDNHLNPFGQCEDDVIVNINESLNINKRFVGVKAGDMDLSASTNQSASSKSVYDNPAEFLIPNLQLEKGKFYDVPFRLNSTSTNRYQFTIEFDPEKLTFENVIGHHGISSTDHFGYQYLDDGLISTIWSGDLPQESDMFVMTFRAREDGYLKDVLKLSEAVTPIRAYTRQNLPQLLSLRFWEKTDPLTPVLLDNSPNPFRDETTIQFQLPEADQIKIDIFDQHGHLFKVIEGSYPKGVHSVKILGNELPVGPLIYHLNTSSAVLVGRMVRLE